MPISDSAVVLQGDTQSLSDEYARALLAFIDRQGKFGNKPTVVDLFHAVRNIPYYSSGERSPEAVLRDNRGACTAKHILLRDALRHIGETADVELIEGDFAISMPIVRSMPADMQAWIRSGGIRDFHCYVVWRGPEREQILDATWPDSLKAYGFPVNANWTGEGNTALAIKPTFVKVRVEDVIARKERLIQTLSREDTHNRRLFLSMLSVWLSGLPTNLTS